MKARYLLAVMPCVLVAGCSCGNNELTTSQAAQVCATLQACFPLEFGSGVWGSLETCTGSIFTFGGVPLPGGNESVPIVSTGLEAPMGEVYRCLLGAGGVCSAAAKCFALVGSGGSCAPPSGLISGQCSGSTLAGCMRDGDAFGVDCSRYGLECGRTSVLFASYSSCTWGACPSSGGLHCRGSRLELCQGSSIALEDCARIGRTCGALPDGGAGCVGGKPCGGGSTCEGDVAVACGTDQQETRLDCTRNRVQKRCESGQCVETGNECKANGGSITCDGSGLKFCQDGLLKTYDCQAWGFSGCAGGACTPKP